jgi:hypothetical protein
MSEVVKIFFAQSNGTGHLHFTFELPRRGIETVPKQKNDCLTKILAK